VTAEILLVGDLILDEPEPDSFFEPSRALLASADVVIGHVEVPHTLRGSEQSTDVPAPPAKPAHLAALARAGFHAATLAGNHMHDAGPAGIADTVATLQGLGLQTTGAGPNLAAPACGWACSATTASARARAGPPRASPAAPMSRC